MCRILGYLGQPVVLKRLLYEPEHSLLVQSYQPKEMTSGVVNADGYGIGWYDPARGIDPFVYRHTLPIWGDANLPHLSRYIESGTILGCVRSATAGQPVDLSNCQPFQCDRWLGVHNGFIEQFRQTLYRPLRDRLPDALYQQIGGSTDSEHIVALFASEVQNNHHKPLDALKATLETLNDLGHRYGVRIAANLILTNGRELIAARFSNVFPAPSLYYHKDAAEFPKSVAIASEPFSDGNWIGCPQNSVLIVGESLDIYQTQL